MPLRTDVSQSHLVYWTLKVEYYRREIEKIVMKRGPDNKERGAPKGDSASWACELLDNADEQGGGEGTSVNFTFRGGLNSEIRKG